jgi:hypothetical protein
METPSYYDRRRKPRRSALFAKPKLTLWIAALALAIAMGSAVSERAEEKALVRGEETSRQAAALLASARVKINGEDDADEETKQGAMKSARANLEKALKLMRGNPALENHPAYTAALADLAALILTAPNPPKKDLKIASKLLGEAWGKANNKIGDEPEVTATDKKFRARIARDRGLTALLSEKLEDSRKWYETAKELGADDRMIADRLEMLDNLERWGE